MVVVLGAQVAQIVQALKLVVPLVIHNAIIVAIVVVLVIAQLVIVAINAQIVKLAIHNAIQIISYYFYSLLYYFFTADISTYKLFINCLSNIVHCKFDSLCIYYNYCS